MYEQAPAPPLRVNLGAAYDLPLSDNRRLVDLLRQLHMKATAQRQDRSWCEVEAGSHRSQT